MAYYKKYIEEHSEYSFAGIFADEGITGTNTKKRDEFNRMIAECEKGNIQRIITKSISRFARNTLDCLQAVRRLKELGVGVYFEKENIDTLDDKGEVLLTILSSLAQDESRSISENCTWSIRKRYERGEVFINTSQFLGYDKDEEGNLVIHKKQAKIVKEIYQWYLDGWTASQIARELEKKRAVNWNGTTKWHESGITNILKNEKYKGDALLQKTYTLDFLSKKRVTNDGKVPQYYVEDNHPAIIDAEMWECVQLEAKRRKQYMNEHTLMGYSRCSNKNPFAFHVICGECGRGFGRVRWASSKGPRFVWQCGFRYHQKGIIGCHNRHIEDSTIELAFIRAWNHLVEDQSNYLEHWNALVKGDDLLKKYKAKQFIELSKNGRITEHVEWKLVLKVLDHIRIYESGEIVIAFLEGTECQF
ncbi:Site-specific DNA recombinase [Anaeromicropila populeti]|uniref:Site-specific DNA recombinase n=2 Tax=Anaeromicropila populeti TaxID=37658 RepID=A0A1I6LRR3_9FIRM|nr:recombinase family protein [Anaeromicropila populeti]SFS06141.1 Site-specific DNA recombinase [Anaeromicropila populeti]